jgi:hypothetical protein
METVLYAIVGAAFAGLIIQGIIELCRYAFRKEREHKQN